MTFSSIKGSKNALNVLTKLIDKDFCSRSLIFCGPLGVGKKTIAKLFAKKLLNPKGSLDNCADFFSLFPESKTGAYQKHQIDQIRQFTQVQPVSASVKVCVIERAEALSEVSCNALLKTVEEPSANVLFIFISKHVAGLLPTLVSRSMVLQFSPASFEETKDYLLTKGNLTPGKAESIAQQSMGFIGIADKMSQQGGEGLYRYGFDLGKALYLNHTLWAVDLCKKIEKEVSDNEMDLDVFLQQVYQVFKDLFLLSLNKDAQIFFKENREELLALKKGEQVDLSCVVEAYHSVKKDLKLNLALRNVLPYKVWQPC